MTVENISTFHINDQLFGVMAKDVQEIKLGLQFTPVPLTPPEIMGLLNLRGQITLAIDLAVRLGLDSSTSINRTTSIIVKSPSGPVCLLTDTVSDVQQIDNDNHAPVPDSVEATVRPMLRSITKVDQRVLHILNIEPIVDIDVDLIPYERLIVEDH